jgi:hypothetical protein
MSKSKAKSILIFELFGIVLIVLVGSALHFTFKLSGGNPLVGVFSAVNESVWEHLKLSFWPALLYAIVEYRCLKKKTSNFFFAKAVSIYLMPLIIVSSFYMYRAFSEENLVLDILIFILAVAIGQLTSYKLMNWKEKSKICTKTSIIALILLASLFIIFTFYPPQLPIFQDSISRGYGIA